MSRIERKAAERSHGLDAEKTEKAAQAEIAKAEKEAEKEIKKARKAAKKEARLGRFRSLKKWQRTLIKVLAIVLAVALVAGGFAYLYFDNLIGRMHDPNNPDDPDDDDYKMSIQPVDGFVNILCMGVDARDMSDYSSCRSDVMVIASIEEETSNITLTSIYRDTYLKMGESSSYSKAGHAMAYGGPTMAMTTVNEALDIDVQHYVIVNWKAVVDLVDCLDGVELDIEQYEIAEMNKCITENARVLGLKAEYIESAGTQTVSGIQAVGYARMRYNVGDDFKRAERVRTIIGRCTEKAKSMTFKQLKRIINKVLPEIKTNLTTTDILAMAKNILNYSISAGESWPYHWWGQFMPDGGAYLVPDTLLNCTVEFHQNVFGQTDYEPSDTVKNMSYKIASDLDYAIYLESISDEDEDEDVNSPGDSDIQSGEGNESSDGGNSEGNASEGGSSEGSGETGGESSGEGNSEAPAA